MPELSSLERTFQTYWNMLSQGYPHPIHEVRFAPPRRWKFDLAWPAYKIAIELEGGVYSGGRHTRGKGFENDCEKYNQAVLLGWSVLRYSTNMLKSDPSGVINEILCLLDQKGVKRNG